MHNANITSAANFEIRLYESSTRLDFVYGPSAGAIASGTVGIERATGVQFI